MSVKAEAVRDLLKAIESGDEDAAAEALESFVYECTDGDGDGEYGGGELRAKPVLGLMVRRDRR